MPPRGRRKRRENALRHGMNMSPDLVTLWLTKEGERVFLVGAHVWIDGHAWVRQPGHTHGETAWEVILPSLNSLRGPGRANPLCKEVPLDRGLRKALAAAHKLGGETAVQQMLQDAVKPSGGQSQLVHRPHFMMPPTARQFNFPGYFPRCSHGADLPWDRMTVVHEDGSTRLLADEGHLTFVNPKHVGTIRMHTWGVRYGR